MPTFVTKQPAPPPVGGLVLTRKPNGARVRIVTPDGYEIWVGVGDIERGKVHLTFRADRAVKIMREELLAT